jgi:ABC-type tungstate transport system permease subunit
MATTTKTENQVIIEMLEEVLERLARIEEDVANQKHRTALLESKTPFVSRGSSKGKHLPNRWA